MPWPARRIALPLALLLACGDDGARSELEEATPDAAGAGPLDASVSLDARIVPPARLDGSTGPTTAGDGAIAQLDAAVRTLAPPLRLLAYNVAGLPEGISQSSPSVNSALISPLLNDYSLALLQEDFTYHAQIVSQAKQPYSSPAYAGGNSLGDGLSFLSNYPYSDFERVPWQACFGVLDSGSDCLTPKGFTFARFQIADGISLDVYDVHTDAGSASGDVGARAMNFSQLAAYIEAHSAGRAVIVAGDLNERYSNPVSYVGTFADRVELRDVWVETRHGGVRPTSNTQAACSTSDANDPLCERIDKLLFRDPATVGDFTLLPSGYAVEGVRFVDPSGAQLSDHRPVTATFDFGAAPVRFKSSSGPQLVGGRQLERDLLQREVLGGVLDHVLGLVLHQRLQDLDLG